MRLRSGALALVGLVVLAGAVSGDQAPAGPGSADRPVDIVVATGGTQGVYFQYAEAVAERIDASARGSVQVVATSGSVENLRMIEDGRADCAFVAGDAATAAVRGETPFAHPLPLTAVARAYDDYLHLVTRRDSSIRSLADLAGQRVSTGAPGSGTRLIARRMLGTADIDPASFTEVELGINESAEAIIAGRIDAFFWSGGLPTPAVSSLASQGVVRLARLDRYVAALRREHGGTYRPATIPPGVYDRRSVQTLAVPNTVVCARSVPDGDVRTLLDTLFSARDQIAATVPQAASLHRGSAIQTTPVDLHPAALGWYRRAKP